MPITLRILRCSLPKSTILRAKHLRYVCRALDLKMATIVRDVDGQGLAQGTMNGGTVIVRWVLYVFPFRTFFLTFFAALRYTAHLLASKTTSPFDYSCPPMNTPVSLTSSKTTIRCFFSRRTIVQAWSGRTQSFRVICLALNHGLVVGPQRSY